jgi:hypothetical protein
MTAHYLTGRYAFPLRSPAYRALVATGLWLRAGFVALSIGAIALVMLATGEATPSIAITTAAVAGVFVRWSWRKARAALDAEASETTSAAAATTIAVPSKPRAERFAGRVETALTR